MNSIVIWATGECYRRFLNTGFFVWLDSVKSKELSVFFQARTHECAIVLNRDNITTLDPNDNLVKLTYRVEDR